MGKWIYISTILNLDARWGFVLSFTPLPLYPWGHIFRRLGGPQCRYGMGQRKISFPYRKSNHDSSVVQHVAYRYTGRADANIHTKGKKKW
jgi:hypothetical protein